MNIFFIVMTIILEHYTQLGRQMHCNKKTKKVKSIWEEERIKGQKEWEKI